jgi:hypothetical protein
MHFSNFVDMQCDMKDLRTVKEKDAKELAKKHSWSYFETRY